MSVAHDESVNDWIKGEMEALADRITTKYGEDFQVMILIATMDTEEKGATAFVFRVDALRRTIHLAQKTMTGLTRLIVDMSERIKAH